MSEYSYGIITVSDSCHRGEATDESGPAIKLLLQREYNAMKITQSTVPDEKDFIEKMLIYYADDLKLHCIITTGGTGFAMRDITPEATKNVIHRECPQLATTMLSEGLKKTPFAALSRAVCGIRDKTLIVNLPGSKKAVVECFEAIQSVIPHAIGLIRDEKTKTVATHKELQKDFNSTLMPDKSNESPMDIQPPSKPEPIRTRLSPDTTSGFDSSSLNTSYASEMSEVEDMKEILNRSSSTMNEIVLDDEIFKNPARKTVEPKAEKPMSISSDTESEISIPRKHVHVCPHKTAKAGDESDRNSAFPMIEVDVALEKIFSKMKRLSEAKTIKSPMNCPPFRASIKDGYAMKAVSKAVKRKVIGFISAGDKIIQADFADNECYKINTGAAVPKFADAIVQVEDTKLLSSTAEGIEEEIELTELPKKDFDIRGIGCDLEVDEVLFKTNGLMGVAEKTILASVGIDIPQKKPRIAVISTGDELVSPTSGDLKEGQIYDSNSTMLKLLLEKFGFEAKLIKIAKDEYNSLKAIVNKAASECDVIISSGGVSMGDKDFVKPLMKELGFEIVFGRVNMKPGKPMTFASNGSTSYFALPGNPVSAFVTFHLFVLPALRFMSGFPEAKCKLPVISTILQLDKYTLDSRPEYARARVSYSKSKGLYYAHMTDNQMSSRVASLIGADVLLHLPGATSKLKCINRGYKMQATAITDHFISDYVH